MKRQVAVTGPLSKDCATVTAENSTRDLGEDGGPGPGSSSWPRQASPVTTCAYWGQWGPSSAPGSPGLAKTERCAHLEGQPPGLLRARYFQKPLVLKERRDRWENPHAYDSSRERVMTKVEQIGTLL